MSGWVLSLVAQKMDFCPVYFSFMSGFTPARPNSLLDSLFIMAPLWTTPMFYSCLSCSLCPDTLYLNLTVTGVDYGSWFEFVVALLFPQ